jgi:3-oxoacyl-[acyl-carrier protein] reductase
MPSATLQDLFGIAGKLAVVTDSGAMSSRDVAPVLATAGAKIILADKQEADMAPIVAQIRQAGGDAEATILDVENEAAVIAFFGQIKASHGSPDIVVNCAAMTNNGPLLDFTETQWDEVMSLDLKSIFFCMREAIRVMREGGNGGRIINISTMGSLHPVLNGNGAYGAARAGLNGLVRSAALDFVRDKILINNVMAGAVLNKVRFHPDMMPRLQAGQLAGPGVDVERRRPLGLGDPRDIAAAVLYLAGPSGGYITGHGIVLDGGFLVS